MPQVPDYGNFKTQPNIAPGVRLTGINPGAAAEGQRNVQASLRGAQESAQAAVDIEVDIANEANTLRVKEALNSLRQEEQRLTYDKTSGYLTQMGSNALNRGAKGSLDQEYSTKLQNYGDRLRAALGNDAQRRLFDERAGAVYTQFSGGIQQHLIKQYYSYGDAVRKDEAETLAQQALMSDDPQVIASSVADLEALAHEQARTYGTPVDVEAYTSPVVRRVIESRIANGYLGTAQRLQETFKGYLSAEDMLALKKTFTEENDRAQAVAAAQHAYNLYLSKGIDAANNYLRGRSARIQATANSHFKGYLAQDELAREERDRTGKANAFQLILQGNHITSSDIEDLSPEAQVAIREFEKKVVEGAYITTDDEYFVDLMTGINNGSLGIDEVLANRDRLSEKDFNTARDAIIKQQEAGSSGGSSSPLARGKQKAFEEAIKWLKLDKPKYTPEDAAALYRTLSVAFDDYVASNGGSMPEDYKAWSLSLFQETQSGVLSSRSIYEEVGRGNRSTIRLDADGLDMVREDLQGVHSRWGSGEIDDLTVRAYASTDATSALHGLDAEVRDVVYAVRQYLEKTTGQAYTNADAERYLRSLIQGGWSVKDIRRELTSDKNLQSASRAVSEVEGF